MPDGVRRCDDCGLRGRFAGKQMRVPGPSEEVQKIHAEAGARFAKAVADIRFDQAPPTWDRIGMKASLYFIDVYRGMIAVSPEEKTAWERRFVQAYDEQFSRREDAMAEVDLMTTAPNAAGSDACRPRR